MTAHDRKPQRAIVIGASVAGSMVAKLLADRFEQVVLIDRDRFPHSATPRTTVPQEYHVHLLLQRGRQIMECLYPGFLAEIEAGGAEIVDLSHGVKWCFGGCWKSRWPTGVTAHYCTRTLIEHVLRKRARALTNLSVREGVAVQELRYDPSTAAVTGVRVFDAHGKKAEIDADLVVDASGRGSAASAWIKELGYGEVEVEQVVSKLGYVSRIYKRNPRIKNAWRVLLVTPKLPHDRRLAVVSPIEGDRYMVTTGGWLGEFPETTQESVLSFLRDLPVADGYEVVKTLEPEGEFKRFRMPGSLRRRYDRMTAWPKGLLVVGDALCSINPIYSQGMSVSAMQIEALERDLDGYLAGRISPQALFATVIEATERSWGQAKAGDEKLLETGRRPTVKERIKDRYFDWMATASAQNRALTIALLKVNNLVADESILVRPTIAWKVLTMMLARNFRLSVR
jgi:2-polyprenyl-6-methoxyphenol hydroxylase-like FAD-dependent oxidoreductase